MTMLNRDNSTSLKNTQPDNVGDQSPQLANCMQAHRTINQKVFFATFLLAGVIGLGLSLMYDFKAMQAVSVAAMCIGFYHLVTKRAKS
ncbi:TPA: hypothetical protein QCJ33_004239 [Enterobacter roggenkampii]|nr:hypothetical protein [Enterobacter roggenkampii]